MELFARIVAIESPQTSSLRLARETILRNFWKWKLKIVGGSKFQKIRKGK